MARESQRCCLSEHKFARRTLADSGNHQGKSVHKFGEDYIEIVDHEDGVNIVDLVVPLEVNLCGHPTVLHW